VSPTGSADPERVSGVAAGCEFGRVSRPRTALVTGAPGSGKSTLARELALRLRSPFIARDDVRGGLFFSAGAWGDELERVPPGDEAVEVFLSTVEVLLTSGVSCIIEYVVRGDRADELDRITALGDCVVIMTTCEDPMGRVEARNLVDRLALNHAVLRAGGFCSIEEHTEAVVARMRGVQDEMLLSFSVPVLEVDTNSGYVPSLDEVAAFVTATD
jgi:hypothetical protein